MNVAGLQTGLRPDGTEREIELMRQDILDMRLSQMRAENVTVLNEVFRPYGVEILSYMGPAKFSLMQHIRCEICEERVYTTQQAYELRMLSQAWGPRYGYLHRGCFDRTMKAETPMATLGRYAEGRV